MRKPQVNPTKTQFFFIDDYFLISNVMIAPNVLAMGRAAVTDWPSYGRFLMKLGFCQVMDKFSGMAYSLCCMPSLFGLFS